MDFRYMSNTLKVLVVGIGLAAALAGCNGGSSTPAASNVSGIASKGPLNGASVCAYAIVNGAKGAAIGACQTTAAGGNYSLDLGSYTGPVLFEASGGNYVDEASGATVPLSAPLHSVLVSVAGGATTAAITPLTELAYRLAMAMSGGLGGANIQAALDKVQTNFGVADIVGVLPVDALNVPVGATDAEKKYALALAMVSQYLNGLPPGATLSDALQTLQGCLATPATGCGVAPLTVGATLNSAMGTFQAGHGSFAGMSLPVAGFGSVVANPGGGGGGGSGGNVGPAVDLAKLATLCPAHASLGANTQYSNCSGANINQNNFAVLNALNAWFAAHGTGMTVYNSNYSGVAVGDSCSFAIEPGLGLWLLTVKNAPVVLTPGSFDGSANSVIEVDAAGEVVRMALGDFMTAGREVSFLSGKIDVVYQAISGGNTTRLFCGNAN